ncbi:MAG: sigma-54-dependent Fis family transcriptional regulator [Deltaproteobacteria bacterium]|nr:sigma-54-dependent Fis family transcriptional regulator [Deltaproteobacteria bacterium]
MAHILIVDDEEALCNLLTALLNERGHTADCAHGHDAAIKVARESPPDLVLLDLNLAGFDGIETLHRLRKNAPETPVVMITAFGDIRAAVRAIKAGATDFISKPFDNEALLASVDTLLAFHCDRLREAPVLVGESVAFRETHALALKFAVPEVNMLLLGETGTGKELFARAIHTASKRQGGPFVVVDCAMLPESLIESELFGFEKGSFTGAVASRIGRLELAQGGTLFLDEIGNLPMLYQTKLLRLLQERTMQRVGSREEVHLDVRVISATNIDLPEAIQNGKFRRDLFYRLQEMTINLPPLRERNGDIRLVAEHFLHRYAREFRAKARKLSGAAIEKLEAYKWPGNVRELESTIKSAVVLADDVVCPEHLPKEISADSVEGALEGAVSKGAGDTDRLKIEFEVDLGSASFDLKALGAKAAETAERLLLQHLLHQKQTSGAQLAKRLGVDPKTLRLKLRHHGFEVASHAAVPRS